MSTTNVFGYLISGTFFVWRYKFTAFPYLALTQRRRASADGERAEGSHGQRTRFSTWGVLTTSNNKYCRGVLIGSALPHCGSSNIRNLLHLVTTNGKKRGKPRGPLAGEASWAGGSALLIFYASGFRNPCVDYHQRFTMYITPDHWKSDIRKWSRLYVYTWKAKNTIFSGHFGTMP